MKVQPFFNLDSRLSLAGYLYPHIGGPYGYISHVIPAGTTTIEYWKKIAASIPYAAVRPFSSLCLKSTSFWTLSPSTEKYLKDCKGSFNYNDPHPIIPDFVGDGTIFTLVGMEESRINSDRWNRSNWSAIDDKTSLEDLLHMLAGFVQTDQIKHARAWGLAYVLKTSWQASNPKKRSYDIYVPPFEWVAEHATFESTHPL